MSDDKEVTQTQIDANGLETGFGGLGSREADYSSAKSLKRIADKLESIEGYIQMLCMTLEKVPDEPYQAEHNTAGQFVEQSFTTPRRVTNLERILSTMGYRHNGH